MFLAKNYEDIKVVKVMYRMLLSLFSRHCTVYMKFAVITEVLSWCRVLKFDEDSDIETRHRTSSLHRPHSVVDRDNLCPQSLCDGLVMENSAPAVLNSNSGHTLRSMPSSTFRPPPVLSSFT